MTRTDFLRQKCQEVSEQSEEITSSERFAKPIIWETPSTLTGVAMTCPIGRLEIAWITAIAVAFGSCANFAKAQDPAQLKALQDRVTALERQNPQNADATPKANETAKAEDVQKADVSQ